MLRIGALRTTNFKSFRLEQWEGLESGSWLRVACCSCRGPGFGPQHPHGSSQPSETPVAEDLIPSDDTRHVPGTQTYMEQNTHTYKVKF